MPAAAAKPKAAAAPIIIKRKKAGGHGGHHGGAWKVAYADFVTAMMAFFLVMWVCGLSESKRKAIAGYFNEPGVFSFLTGKALPVEPLEVTETRHQGDGSGRTTADVAVTEPSRCRTDGTAEEKSKLVKAAKEIEEQLKKMAQKDANWRLILGSITLQITNEGLRIEMAESNDLAYFDVGGAQPRRVCRDVLAALAPKLAALGNQLAMEGHTDTRGYGHGAGYSNWELSADRANAARKILLENGIPEKQIAGVTGYADRRLRKPAAPYEASNRRVSIIVKYTGPVDEVPKPSTPTSIMPTSIAPTFAPH